jgi:hypothetical protein
VSQKKFNELAVSASSQHDTPKVYGSTCNRLLQSISITTGVLLANPYLILLKQLQSRVCLHNVPPVCLFGWWKQ